MERVQQMRARSRSRPQRGGSFDRARVAWCAGAQRRKKRQAAASRVLPGLQPSVFWIHLTCTVGRFQLIIVQQNSSSLPVTCIVLQTADVTKNNKQHTTFTSKPLLYTLTTARARHRHQLTSGVEGDG